MGICQLLNDTWDAVQIELKGEYSPTRVLALNDYTNVAPWWRIVVFILLTPLPYLVYICLPETVNLSSPSIGMRNNKTLFGRFFLSYTMWCLLQMHKISERMLLLSLSKKQLVVSAVTVAALSTGVELLYAWWIGFPVPYTIHMMAVPYVSLMFFALAIAWYPHKMNAGIESTAFSMVLPVLKTFYRVLFSYFCRSASGERITIVVVFNADLVNALFVNFCMQYQPSLMTTGCLMIANALQTIQLLRPVLGQQHGRNPSELELLERKYASLVRKLMYASEFSILTAYAELITPIVYSMYLFIVFHMPNRDYYSQIASMDSTHLAKTVLNVLLYSLVELSAFIALSQTLKRRLKFSTMHQLAFVLDRQMLYVQTAIILWVFYTTQISLEHYGTDYTFAFAWLQGNTTSA